MIAGARTRLHEQLARAIVGFSTAPVRRWEVPRSGAAATRYACADGTTLHADVVAPPGSARGTVVLGHGWRDGRRQLAFLAPALVAKGFRVVAIDFRGHGRSGGGRVTIGAHEAEDVRTALAAARAAGGPVGYLGYSMGASAYLLAGVEADAAVLDSPYDSLDGAVAARARRFRLSPRFARVIADEATRVIGTPIDRVRPIDAVGALARPTLLVFAAGDPWIDADVRAAFARRLAHGSTMRVVPGGHHAHFRRGWRSEVVGFFDARLPPLHSSQTTSDVTAGAAT